MSRLEVLRKKPRSYTSVRDYFNDDSALFAENRWLGSQVAREDYRITAEYLLTSLALRGTDDVLEIGCGPGVWTDAVSQRCRHVTAVDISEEMLRQARARVKTSNVEFYRANFDQCKELEAYDRVFSVRVLEYFTDPRFTINKMYAVTKEGGRTVTVTKTWPTLIAVRAKIWRQLRRVLARDQSPSLDKLMHRLRASTLKTLFLESGFQRVDIYPVVLRMPLFVHGRYPLPFAGAAWKDKYEGAMLRLCNSLSRKVMCAPSVIRRLCMPFSETYLVVADK